MKRRVIIQPHCIVFSVAMLLMAIAAKRFDNNVFVFELCVAIISAVFIIAMSLRYRFYVDRTVRGALKGIKGVNRLYLEKFSVPVVVTGVEGDILWYNNKFGKKLLNGSDCVGDPIAPFIGGFDLDELTDGKTVSVEYEGRYYTVIASNVDDGLIFYYIDDTEFQVTARLYNDTRPVVALAKQFPDFLKRQFAERP